MSRSPTTVFILGAGASKDAGVPLMRDFLDRAMPLRVAEPPLSLAYDLVAKARSQLQTAHSKARLDIRNLESVFAAFEMAQLFGRLGSLSAREIGGLIPAMRTVIVRAIEHSMNVPINRDRRLHAPMHYDRFAALVGTLRNLGGHRISIATFNYDVAIELGLRLQGLRADYCLNDHPESGETVEVMKLHGSINWAQCPRCQGVAALDVVPLADKFAAGFEGVDPGVSFAPTTFPVSQELCKVHCPDCRQQRATEPMIVPPTLNKSEAHQALASVWRRAATRLSEANYIAIIGYSWPTTDSFFHPLYALGTISDTLLSRIWICDPAASVLEKFKTDLFGEQARDCLCPVERTFGEAVTEIANYFQIRREALTTFQAH